MNVLRSNSTDLPAAGYDGHSRGYSTRRSERLVRRTMEALGIAFEASTAVVAQDTTAWGPGVQWIPLISLLLVIEQHGIRFWGTRRQPFDPRELVWTSALGKGGEGVAKLVTSLNTVGVQKRFTNIWSTADSRPSAAAESYFNVGSRSIYQELAILAHASLNNVESIIKLIAIDKNYSFKYFSIIIELAEFGTLRQYLAKHRGISEAKSRQFCREITSALEYLHSMEVLHNDIKMENILITRTGAKLSDFGHAIFNFRQQSRRRLEIEGRLIGTGRWTAPEFHDPNLVQENDTLSPTSDIYSLGFVIACLAAGCEVFIELDDHDLNERKCRDKIISNLPETIMVDSAWASGILRKSLRLNPLERFVSASQLLMSLRNTS